jgi:hypothetical protein
MSVGTRRFAAAQRTAADRPRARFWRLASWLLIVPTLSLFSFSVVAGASDFGRDPDYAAAVTAVAPHDPHAGGTYVVVTAEPEGNALTRALSAPGKVVCWIGPAQLKRVSAVYRTGQVTVTIGRTSVVIVTVSGATEPGLRELLGPNLSCRLVQVSRTFFLPFDAHGS